MFWTGDDDRKVSNFANHFPTSKLFSKVSRCNFTLFKTFRFYKKNAKSSFKTSFSLPEKGWLFNISKACDKSGESGPGK